MNYKRQIITPIHKKDSKALAENYRPIALTSHIIRTFERAVKDKIVHHLESNSLLCNNQHGFRKGRSCLTQLLSHINEILNNGLEGMETDVVYLDYQKAFHKVDFEILLRKLKRYGIDGKLYKWLENYLQDRYQTVTVEGKESKTAKVHSGVFQGTVLSSILFIIYINDINECVEKCTFSCFADDTRVKNKTQIIYDLKTFNMS